MEYFAIFQMAIAIVFFKYRIECVVDLLRTGLNAGRESMYPLITVFDMHMHSSSTYMECTRSASTISVSKIGENIYRSDVQVTFDLQPSL